jgi:DNA-binding XRE family transcriptional regulator
MVKTKNMKLSEIVIDEKIYPRESVKQDLVDEYVEAMEGGAIFPPLVIHESTDLLLDGLHRYKAYVKRNVTEVEVEIDPEPIITNLDKERFKLLLRAAWYNAKHGIQLKNTEKKEVARKVATADVNGEITQENLAKQLGVTHKSISNWVKDIQDVRDNRRNIIIYHLSQLGWTQEEIGETVGVSRPQITDILNVGFGKFTKTDIELLGKGYKIEDIASKMDCGDIPLLWGISLKDQTDDYVKMVKFGCEPKIYNVWGFQDRDTRLGVKMPANIPGQIAMNVICRHTKPNNLVVDPMAGGGSTIDACLVMGRKCRAYDVEPNKYITNPTETRKDIIKNDITQGLPERAKNCDLMFLDPPYYNMVFDLYKDIDDFYGFVRKLAEVTDFNLKKGGCVAYIIQDMTEKGTYCLSGESYKIFSEKFNYVEHISVPLATEQFLPQQVIKAKADHHLLGSNRDLYIFRKL